MALIQISVIVLTIISAMYLISFWAMPKKSDIEKLSIYENGFNPFGDSRMKIDIIFWLIGLLYLIFDLEIIFIFPFISIVYILNSYLAFWVFLFFLIILALGFVFEYKMGSLKILPQPTHGDLN
uniref:NADH-ubiquinone oxidoreductase chain 3 n=1 Tax=Rhizophydium sp. 136 TaxID=60187 RepID=Q950L3_9FUNG|nr:NADH dehydrogenase subunit 3 [Rhizophydium sp. 136]AAK84295.1 NADH dehydrogenase subunit 3 [Rhizophydium sp. 136]